jgi:ATP-dependent RNA helicase DDX3X
VKALESGPDGRTLVFVQKKRTATWLKKQLSKGGPSDGKPDERFTPIPATDIHGDRSQSQREAALESFRSGKFRVLVATDVAARGLDISGVEHVINMDLPTAKEEFDSYTHRIGRTGRAGHEGLATSLFITGDGLSSNSKIAGLMIEQLHEAGQEVPDWLEAEVAGGGGGGGITPAKRKQQFGGSDVRRSSGRGGRGSNGKRPAGNFQRGGGRGRGGRGGGRAN